MNRCFLTSRLGALQGAVALLLTVGVIGCGGGSKAATVDLFPEFVVSDPTAKSQTKSDITITVEPLSKADMYGYPELFQFERKQVAKEIADGINFEEYYKKDYTGAYWCYTFGVAEDQVAAFHVRVENGTDHILRMKDARIYLEVPNHDPIAAVTRVGDPSLMPRPAADPITPLAPRSALQADESLVHWVTYFEEDAERKRKKHTLFDGHYKVPIGLASQVIALNRPAYKLVADVGTEILPGRSYEGILLFPVIISFKDATLSFFDIHTKTDAAGNPVEKQSFAFPLKLNRVQLQWDGDQEKRWKPVTGTPASAS